MSDYFQCPKCGIAPKPSDPRAQDQGVCDSCWTDYFMGEWYQQVSDAFGNSEAVRQRQKQPRRNLDNIA